jgi:hypothetical protein
MSIDTLSTMTLISLADVYDMTPGTYDDNFLRYNSVSGWTGYYINLSGIAYKDEVVLTGRTIIGLSGLTGGGTLNNDIVITHLTANTSVVSNPTQTPTTILQNINYDSYGHITSYEISDYSDYWVRYISDAQDVDVTDVTSYTEPYLYYNSTTSKWVPTGLTMNRISGLQTELSQYVKRSGEISQSIQGDINISKELYVGSDLYVVGNTTTDGLIVGNKFIELNSGGSLTTNDLIGFKINRQGVPLSQKNDFYIVYDEGTSHLVSGGSLKIGISNDLKIVATTTNTPIDGAVSYWYKPAGKTGYYENSNKLLWLSGTSILQINGSVSAITYYGDGSNLTGIGDTTTASNGLTEVVNDIQLGGTLISNTDIELGVYNLSIATLGSITGQSSVILGGTGNTILHDRSVILGGYDITTVSGDTAYAPRFESDMPGEGIVLKSPDGTRWKITVDNKGDLTSTQQ